MLPFGPHHGFGEIPGALHIHVRQGELIAFKNPVDAFTPRTIDGSGFDAFFLRRKAAAALDHDGLLLLGIARGGGLGFVCLPFLEHMPCHFRQLVLIVYFIGKLPHLSPLCRIRRFVSFLQQKYCNSLLLFAFFKYMQICTVVKTHFFSQEVTPATKVAGKTFRGRAAQAVSRKRRMKAHRRQGAACAAYAGR